MKTTLQKYIEQLSEAERSFYVSGNRVHFTRGQEHVSLDITRSSPSDVAAEIIGKICAVNAMADLSRKLKREPSIEELADEADEHAHDFADMVRRKVLHMGASDFKKIIEDLFPGLDKEAPKDLDEQLEEGFHVPENELKMGRFIRWYDSESDKLMHGQIVNVSAHNVTVNDGKFKTDKTFTVVPDKIIKVMEAPKKEGKEMKVVWSRGL
jgi:hypothetical protein